MNRIQKTLFAAWASLQFWSPCFAETSSKAIALNNEGVKALNVRDYKRAFQSFAGALKLEPQYQLARDNMSIAHDTYGEHLKASHPEEALREFRQALLFKPTNALSRHNMESLLQRMGFNPTKHLAMADKAFSAGDYESAAFEYSEVLRLKEDSGIRKKLERAFSLMGQPNRAFFKNIVLPENKENVTAISSKATSVRWTASTVDQYMQELQRRIKRCWFPPKSNMSQHACVSFEIEKSGSVKNLKMLKHCGSLQGDRAALEAIENAAPFVRIPNGGPKSLGIKFVFSYNVFSRGGEGAEEHGGGTLPSLAR